MEKNIEPTDEDEDESWRKMYLFHPQPDEDIEIHLNIRKDGRREDFKMCDDMTLGEMFDYAWEVITEEPEEGEAEAQDADDSMGEASETDDDDGDF